MTNAVTSKEQNPNVEVMIHRDDIVWKEISFDLLTETSSVIKLILKDFLPKSYQGEVSVILSNDAKLFQLNETYRRRSKPTNVLSFPYGEDAFHKGILGDIFLSYETLAQEAQEQGKSFHDHYIHLIIHGILHLLGYDHEQEAEAEEMEAIEIEFLEKLGIPNPYIN